MTNSLLNTTQVALLTNRSGGSLAQGAVGVLDPDNDESFITTTTPDYQTGQVVVVLDPAGIPNGAVGTVAIAGYVPKVLLGNSATRLDSFFTSASAGLGAAAAGAAPGAFGVALETSASPAGYLGNFPLAVGTTARGQAEGRLTLTSGNPVTSADVTAAATLYYTPYTGGQIGLYYGGAWGLYSFSEVSLSLAGAASGTIYDVFGYWSGSALVLETLAWASASARATALARQDGVWTKSGDATRRYLGTIRASGSGTCEDSVAKRFVWNADNRARRLLFRREETLSWVANGAWQMANTSSANRVEVVVGLQVSDIDLVLGVLPGGGALNLPMGAAIGEDSETAPTELYQLGSYMAYMNNITAFVASHFRKSPAIGYHYYQWLEYGNGGTFYGYQAASPGEVEIFAGMLGSIEA